MSKRELITKDFALYVVHYFASMQTWSKEDILSEIDRKIKEAKEDVVRCKDCKHWLKDVAGCTDVVGRCEWANYMVGAVGHCVYGERKDNATD